MGRAKTTDDESEETQHIKMTAAELAAFVEQKIREATGRRVTDSEGNEVPLALHRQDHAHGPIVSVVLAIGSHVGLHFNPAGHSPFDTAVKALIGATE